MEIKSNISLTNGIPTSKLGEWPGQLPSKWTSSLKVFQNTSNNKLFESISQILIKQDKSLPILGRKHFEIPNSKETEFKPGLKMFIKERRKEYEDKPVGLKKVITNFTETKYSTEKKHFEPKYCEEQKFKTQIKTFSNFYQNNHQVFLENEMGEKRRIKTMQQRRNHLMSTCPGDKSFKNPEYSSDFYKGGGLIPGSSNTFNLNKTASKWKTNFFETLDLTQKTLKPEKIWKNKQKNEDILSQTHYVSKLTNWDNTTLKEYRPDLFEKNTNPPTNRSIKGRIGGGGGGERKQTNPKNKKK